MRKLLLISAACFVLVLVLFCGPPRAAALDVNPNLTTSKVPASSPPSNSGSDVIVEGSPGQSISQDVVSRTKATWPWYVTRASGLVAAALLVILVLFGIGQVTGFTFKILDPITAWATHRAIGLAFGVAVLVHIFSLLFDHFVPFSIATILIPFASHWKLVTLFGIHFGTLWTAFGIFAFYGVIAIIVSSLLWVDKKPYTWKILHLLAYLVVVMAFFHALYVGTDLAHGVYRWLWIISGFVLLLAAGYRLWRAKTI